VMGLRGEKNTWFKGKRRGGAVAACKWGSLGSKLWGLPRGGGRRGGAVAACKRGSYYFLLALAVHHRPRYLQIHSLHLGPCHLLMTEVHPVDPLSLLL